MTTRMDAKQEPSTPLTIVYDEARDVVTVNGVNYAGVFFRTLAWPNPRRLYRFEREGTNVILHDMGDAFRNPGERGH